MADVHQRKTGNDNLCAGDKFRTIKFPKRSAKNLPFNSSGSLAENPNKNFQGCSAYTSGNDYIKSLCSTVAQYQEMNLPYQPLRVVIMPATRCNGSFMKFMQYATAAASYNYYIIIVAWAHTGTRTPKKEAGGFVFGDSCLLDMNDLYSQWYNYTLKASAKHGLEIYY